MTTRPIIIEKFQKSNTRNGLITSYYMINNVTIAPIVYTRITYVNGQTIHWEYRTQRRRGVERTEQ